MWWQTASLVPLGTAMYILQLWKFSKQCTLKHEWSWSIDYSGDWLWFILKKKMDSVLFPCNDKFPTVAARKFEILWQWIVINTTAANGTYYLDYYWRKERTILSLKMSGCVFCLWADENIASEIWGRHFVCFCWSLTEDKARGVSVHKYIDNTMQISLN